MRTQEEMYRLFHSIAREDTRILAMYLNGSRTNENAPVDIFQDYDLVYVVSETAPFREDRTWIGRFGTVLYMQYPDEHPTLPSDKENFYGWLMQFDDGVRVDLHVESVAHALANIRRDSLCTVLLDKQGILPPLPPASDRSHWVQKPTEAEFLACCNEFWWCTNNMAKGLWREEMPYVQDMANCVVRKELERMLSWKIGIGKDFRVSVGKSGKYFSRFLSEAEYRQYLDTYFGGQTEAAWDAVMTMCGLFTQTSAWVSNRLNYALDAEEAARAQAFLAHVRQLPRDAKEIY